MVVRRAAHKLGYRFRLHVKDLPGSPDLVFPSRRKVIFVHGCFWHRHVGCKKSTTPKTRTTFWIEKFETNRKRDEQAIEKLAELGWSSLIVWECEARPGVMLDEKLCKFLA